MTAGSRPATLDDSISTATVAPPETERAGALRTEQQRLALPPALHAADRAIVRGTEFVLFGVGAVFTVMITLEVISRYVFSFSIFFVNALARLLLVWFFLLGAGIALRHGAHVGFELVVSRLTPARRRAVLLTGYGLALVFFLEMVWSGAYSIGPSISQIEAGLQISLIWIVAAVPVGFALLVYHMLVLIVAELRAHPEVGRR